MEEDRNGEMASHKYVEIAITDAFRKHVNLRLDASAGALGENQPFTIFRVPSRMRRINKECYEPQIVSIGPYHRGKKHLHAMEEHKWRYLRHFLDRNRKNGWEVYFKEMKVIELQVRSHYAERVELSSDEFAEMLLLDGCFILEFIHRVIHNEEDILCVPGGILRCTIQSDLFFLENQIPFIVLEQLFNLSSNPNGSPSESLVHHVSKLLDSGSTSDHVITFDGEFTFYHLVHLSHHYFVSAPQASPSISKSERLGIHTIRRILRLEKLMTLLFSCLFCFWRRSTSESILITIPSATELQVSGIKLKKKTSKNFLDVTFRLEDGVLEIPPLLLEHDIEYKFTNLVAFERTTRMEKRYLTNYAAFMQFLVNTPKDVAILQQCGIIQNALPSEEAAARFFNNLGDFIVFERKDNYLTKLFEDVRRYCESNWHKHRAILIRTYFSNPWAILSLVAAIILLLLTITQTFFRIYSYFHPHP